MKAIFILLLSLSTVLCSQNYDVSSIENSLILKEANFGIIQQIRDLIKVFIEEIQNQFKALLETLKNTLAKIYARIIATLEKSKSKLNSVTIRAEILIQVLKSKNGTFKECAENIEPELIQLKNTTNQSLNKCGDDYVKTLKDYENAVNKNITNINEQIEELRLAVTNCIQLNPFQTVKCLWEKYGEYTKKISNILKSVQNAVKNAVTEGIKAVNGVQKCSHSVIANAIVETEEIKKKLDVCLQMTTTTGAPESTTTTSASQETTPEDATTTTTAVPEEETTTAAPEEETTTAP